jgi:DNA invertase Pin-like site-specific DNA recombinase
MNKNIQLKYFAYCRKSSEDSQRQIASIGDQMQALEKVISNESLYLVAPPFTEERSSKDPGRPIFNQMLERIEKGEANALLCWDIDRLYRNPVDEGRLRWMLQKGVIKVIKTPYRSFYPEDAGLLMGVEGGRATDYVIRLSKNVKRGLTSKALKGWRPNGGPIGYLNHGTEKGNKTIISDPDRFFLVKKMWDMFNSGNYTVSKIREIATNEWGLRTLQRRRQGGRPLTMSHMYRIFNDTYYYGYFPWKDHETGEEIIVRGLHEPMITEDEYWRAQMLLGKKGKARPKVREFAYTGLMKCGECQSGITAEEKLQIICSGCKHKFSYINKQECPKCSTKIDNMINPVKLHYVYYHCSKKRGPCSQKTIRLEELESQFQDELKKITIDEDYLNLALEYLQDKQKDFGKEESSKRVSLDSSYNNCQTRLKNLHREYTSPQNAKHEIYSTEEFIILKQELNKEKQNLEKEMELVESRLNSSLEATIKTFNFCRFAVHHFQTGTLQQKRTVITALGSNIELKDKNLRILKPHPFILIENELNKKKIAENRIEPKNDLVDISKYKKTESLNSVSLEMLRE